MYREWGFDSSPFGTQPVPSSEKGDRLLIGRTSELKKVMGRLKNPPKHVTVEGPNGIGKTSLVNVATYRVLKDFEDGKSTTPLVMCDDIVQFRPDESSEDFQQRACLSIAQTILGKIGKRISSDPLATQVERWMNAPEYKSIQAGLQVLGFGGDLGETQAPNTSDGFARDGLRRTIKGWLLKAFDADEIASGAGVVCVLDNLEILRTSKNARQALESLRDEILSWPGLRWVLCGANGIVDGVATSPRLAGRLHAPLRVEGVSQSDAGAVMQARVDVLGVVEAPYLPISIEGFEELHRTVNSNLRSALSLADEFCTYVYEEFEKDERPSSDGPLMHEWLAERSEEVRLAVSAEVGPRAHRLFNEISDAGGTCSPSEFDSFSFNSMQAMRPHVKSLESAGVVSTERDNTDQRRKTIQITTKGWLLRRALSE